MSREKNDGTRWNVVRNNPTDADLMRFRGKKVRYSIYQMERGKEGTLHAQGYIELKRSMTDKEIRKYLPGFHIELCGGNQQSNIKYCSKNKTKVSGPHEYGVKCQQGKRTDLENMYDMIKKGEDELAILERYPNTYMRNYKAYDRVKALLLSRQEKYVPTVTVLIGEPGVGKTRYVFDYAKKNNMRVYSIPYPTSSTIWFDGYNGQEILLIDDFDGQIPFKLLLQILDRYEMQVPVKGGFVPLNPKEIYITSNDEIDQWYGERNQTDLRALRRRITTISHVKAEKEELFDDSHDRHRRSVEASNHSLRARDPIILEF